MYVISLKMRLLLFLSHLSLYKAEECTGKGEDREDHEIKHYRSGGQEIKRYLKFFFISRIQAGKDNTRELVTLVGLFPLHSGPNCDNIVSVKNYNGFQRMEAFVLALNELNYKRQQRMNISLTSKVLNPILQALSGSASFHGSHSL